MARQIGKPVKFSRVAEDLIHFLEARRKSNRGARVLVLGPAAVHNARPCSAYTSPQAKLMAKRLLPPRAEGDREDEGAASAHGGARSTPALCIPLSDEAARQRCVGQQFFGTVRAFAPTN